MFEFDDLRTIVMTILAYFGLAKASVADLHCELVSGNLPETGLYKLLRISQVEEFVAFHNLAKQLVEMLIDTNVERSQKTDEGEKFVLEHQQLRPWLRGLAPMIGDPAKRRRLFVGLAQADRIVEQDLAKAIGREQNKGNVVRREN